MNWKFLISLSRSLIFLIVLFIPCILTLKDKYVKVSHYDLSIKKDPFCSVYCFMPWILLHLISFLFFVNIHEFVITFHFSESLCFRLFSLIKHLPRFFLAIWMSVGREEEETCRIMSQPGWKFLNFYSIFNLTCLSNYYYKILAYLHKCYLLMDCRHLEDRQVFITFFFKVSQSS